MIDNDRLTLAAVLAFVHAVVSRFLVSFTAEITQPSSGPLLIAALLGLVNFALFGFLFITLKRLLNERYHFQEADLPILVLIALNAVAVLIILLPAVGLGYSQFSLVSRILTVVAGLAWIGMGVRLLKLPRDRIKLLRPYAFVVAAAGISYASILLTPVGLILSRAGDVLLGVIFIQETGKPEAGKIEA